MPGADDERGRQGGRNLVLRATATYMMRVPHLLSAIEMRDIVTAPFAHVVRNEAVPAAVYEQLALSFPGLETLVGSREAVGANVAVLMASQDVLKDPRIPSLWRTFFEYYTSADYWQEVVQIFAPEFRRAFPDLEERVGRAYKDWRVVPRGLEGTAEVRLDCQFVMNTPVVKPSSVRTPHVDLGDKIFSAMLYFREPTDTSTGGDLDLYRWHRAPRFIKHRVLPRDIERVQTVPYAANTYVGFVNSEVAVHGVSPRSITSVPRRYINFIAELPVKAFKPQQLGKLRRWFLSNVLSSCLE